MLLLLLGLQTNYLFVEQQRVLHFWLSTEGNKNLSRLPKGRGAASTQDWLPFFPQKAQEQGGTKPRGPALGRKLAE